MLVREKRTRFPGMAVGQTDSVMKRVGMSINKLERREGRMGFHIQRTRYIEFAST